MNPVINRTILKTVQISLDNCNIFRSSISESTSDTNRDKAITGIACAIGAVSGGLDVTTSATNGEIIDNNDDDIDHVMNRSNCWINFGMAGSALLGLWLLGTFPFGSAGKQIPR